MIHLFAFAQCWSNDETVPIAVLFKLLWGHYEDIHSLSDTIQAHVNITNDLARVVISGLDHQDIHITVRPHLPTRCRAKKDNALRLSNVHDPLDNILQDGLTESVCLCHRSLSFLRQQYRGAHSVLLLRPMFKGLG
jgi:hypothetical protein